MAKNRSRISQNASGQASPTLRLEYLDPSDLQANPLNYRRHPAKQVDALRDVIGEVGWAGALLFNERTKRLIDGHARKDLFGGQKVPVLIGDWSEEQEKKILATLDPLAALANTNKDALDALLREVQTGSEGLAGMLTELARENGIVPSVDQETAPDTSSPEIKERFDVLVECDSEEAQVALLERLTVEGLKCRSLIA